MDFWDNYDWAQILQNVVIAILILIATWVLARVVKWAIGKLVSKIGFLQKQGADGESLGESLGQIGSLLVWLFGLVAVLQVFALDAALSPIQSLLDNVMSYLPNIIGAAFVFFIGFVLAKILKQLVETALRAANLESLAAKLSPNRAATAVGAGDPVAQPAADTDNNLVRNLPSLVGNLVFAIVLIVVSIAALQVLGIRSISDPAQRMLTIILDAIPLIIAAALILGLGFLIAKFVGELLESTLRGLGTDRAVASLGIAPEGTSASGVITKIAQVAIMIFFAIMATRTLNFPEVTAILNEVLELGGRVLFGGAIIAAGFLVASLLSRAVGNGTASTIIRYATLVLFVAMGLQYMGIADSIINLAFGSLVVGGALAAALAYGLGGRDAAARSLEKAQRKVEDAPKAGDTPTA
ncbi:mechanosensitive ion channel [Ornithinicoccus hortensis]|uniref:Putative transporter (Transmembrane protein) n=1 Tax=Ornithinicoccus hortensis TaxID=82346 RepID=A0A542YM29_9MICO|nr:mechanosensitive ion channel [Ornithinicoccus hortensis]TQL49150.1 putative transporter (transmembrane protein) [Ornithinicoccus hortensis]